MKITIELDNDIYDYLKKRAKEMNERIGVEIITVEDMAAGLLIARGDKEERKEDL